MVSPHASSLLPLWARLKRMAAGGPETAARREAVRLRSEMVRLYGQGRFAEAAVTARRLLDRQRATLGATHPDSIRGLFNLALLDQKAGDARSAAVLVEQVLALRRATLGPYHPETAEAESLLAALCGSAVGPPPAAAGRDAVLAWVIAELLADGA